MDIITPISFLIDCSGYPVVATDAEWGSDNRYLTKQFTFYKRKDGFLERGLSIVLWDNSLPKVIYPDSDVHIIQCDVNNTYLTQTAILANKLEVLMYYSPRDIEGMLGFGIWRNLLAPKPDPDFPDRKIDSLISQKRNLTGTFDICGTEYTLKDWMGAFTTSLEKAFEIVGHEPLGKTLAKEYAHSNPGWTKGNMEVWAMDKSEDFLRYALGDTWDFGVLVNRRIKQVNQIVAEALNEKGVVVPPFTYKDFPRTSGKLVSEVYERWVMVKYTNLYRATLLLTDAANDKEWKQLEEILGDRSDLDKTRKKIQWLESVVPGMAAGRIDSYLLLSKRNSTGVYNAVVNGGRCVNEEPKVNPYEQRLNDVINTDNSSCYGSGLLAFDQPFGLPTLYERCKDDRDITLGDFLKKNKSDLVDGLYQIYVSGTLDFEQDLVQSKYGLNTTTIERNLIKNFETLDLSNPTGLSIELAHVAGDLRLTLSELENALLTCRDLEIINQVSTPQELKGWMGLKVVAAAYYPKSLEVSHEEFISTVENPDTRGGKKAAGDTRTRKWCRIHWSEFVGQFIKIRKTYKKQYKTTGDKQYNLLQNAVKLFINTTYGDIAAPYFILGNTVVANNITARARCGVWQMSKSLLGIQSITDGVLFSWRRIAYLKTQLKSFAKPGFHTLANRERFMNCRNIEVRSLSDVDWHQRFEDDIKALEEVKVEFFGFFIFVQNGLYRIASLFLQEYLDFVEVLKKCELDSQRELDEAILDHLKTFWGVYDLSYQYDIESKYGETAREAVYFGTSDYLLHDCVDTNTKTPEGVNYLIKVRGAKPEDHPKKLWMWHLLNPQKYPLPYPDHKETRLLGVSEFQENPNKYPDKLPGYEVEVSYVHTPHSPGNTFKTGDEMKKFEANKRKAIARFKKNRTPGTYYGLAAKIRGV